ncbi:hypothetical protein JJC00_07420 [Bradyrhizobium diazoefficiens]|uniref:hypothetical protein n=1 Tax=Bradyrhizobium diazoefficiens TaxID=1355477 RepID=UPI00190A58CD|nr:hypothetical protein [Bradyrhizobium diazoefficiens]QQO35471.1 hypothetical protein JJC00_07420 [Bradyrhizobium diazoefficiens]
MASRFYRLWMGAYAEALFQRSKREKQQMMWLQYNLMRLGSEVVRSEHWSIAADQPVRHEHGAAKIARTGETTLGDLKQIGREAFPEAPTMWRQA